MTLWALLCMAGMMACTPTDLLLRVEAGKRLEVDYPQYEAYEARVRNASTKDVNVAVMDKSRDEQLRGFGLAKRAKATVLVEQGSKLVLENPSDERVKLSLRIVEKDASVFEQKGDYVDFTLENKTARSIPLLIPKVMNPNLSPFSKSGVSLKMGQEILFRENGKTYVLLTVDERIQPGEVLDVAAVLKARRKELGL